MEYFTAEQIADQCSSFDGRSNRAAINRLFREQDESYSAPIRGRFNVTNRAIRHLRKFESESGQYLLGLEYAMFLDDEIGRIVNNDSNW